MYSAKAPEQGATKYSSAAFPSFIEKERRGTLIP
jgi:hypothetical protein